MVLSKYFIQSQVSTLPIAISEVANFLNIDNSDGDYDDELTSIINAVVDFFEKTGNYYIRETVLLNQRMCFDDFFELRKMPFKEIVTFKYYDDDDVLQDFTDYEIVEDNVFYRLQIKEKPNLSTGKLYPIEINFKAGLVNDSENLLSEDLKIALLQHINFWYTNKGECTSSSFFNSDFMKIYGIYQRKEIFF